MKKIFLALCFSLFACGAFAKGLVIDYFSPSGVTFGANFGGDIFSCAYGLWIDKHDLTKVTEQWNYNYEYEYSSGYYEETKETVSATNVGPYIQLDWSILPIKVNVASSEMRIGANIGAQMAILYNSEFDCDIASSFLLGVQARYKNFDLTLGWKETVYFQEVIRSSDDFEDNSEEYKVDGNGIHNSFQMGFKYHFGNRKTQKSASIPAIENSTRTRILPISGLMRI